MKNVRVDPRYMSDAYYEYCIPCGNYCSSGCSVTDEVQELECPIRKCLGR